MYDDGLRQRNRDAGGTVHHHLVNDQHHEHDRGLRLRDDHHRPAVRRMRLGVRAGPVGHDAQWLRPVADLLSLPPPQHRPQYLRHGEHSLRRTAAADNLQTILRRLLPMDLGAADECLVAVGRSAAGRGLLHRLRKLRG